MPQPTPAINAYAFSIQLDLDAAEIGLPAQSRQSWHHLRKAVVRNLAAYAHRYAGGWNPSRVELTVPRAWSSALQSNGKNMFEFNKLCKWLERCCLTYRIGVSAGTTPHLTLY